MQYGLIKMKGGKKEPVPLKKPNAAFLNNNDDDDDDVTAPIRNPVPVFKETTLPQVDDSSIYDYDGQYESFMPAAKSAKKDVQKEKDEPKARYVQNLLVTSKIRERERDKAYERKLKKEQNEEGEFADKPKFVTAAYREKLLEDKKWEVADRISDALEEKTDVRTLGMEGFYAGLLTKNIAMGGEVEKNALSAYTAGSGGQKRIIPLSGESVVQIPPPEPQASASALPAPAVSSSRHTAAPSVSTVEHATAADPPGATDRTMTPAAIASASVPAPTVDTGARVDAARERYLARKRGATQMSESTAS